MSDLHLPAPDGGLLNRLSERGLFKTAGVYVGTATSAVLFVNFLAEHFGLSPHLVTAVMALAVLALPSVLLMAYCRGGAGHRVCLQRSHKVALATNGVLAAALLGVGFADKPMGRVSRTVVAEGADGERIERVVANEAFRKRVGAFYLDGPADEPWLGRAAAYGVAFDLDQSPFLSLRTPDAFAERFRRAGYADGLGVPLALAQKEAARARLDAFMTGDVSRVEGGVRVAVRLTDGATGREMATFDETGASVLDVADRVATWVRDELDLPTDRRADVADLPAADLLTSNDDALRAWVEGFHAYSYGQDGAGAGAHFERAVELDPSFAMAHLLRTNAQMQAGDIPGVQASLAAARQHDYRLSESNRHVISFNEMMLSGRPDEGYAAIQRWAELFPERTDARSMLALFASVRGDHDVAVRALEEILELDPGETDAHLQAASLLVRQNRLDDAARHYRAFTETEPDRADGLRGLATVAQLRGDSEGRVKALRRAALAEPDDVSAAIALASALADVGQVDKSMEGYRQALAMAKTPGERARVLDARAMELFNLGQTDAALADLDAQWAAKAPITDEASLALEKAWYAGTLVEHSLDDQGRAGIDAAQAHPAVQNVPIFAARALLYEAGRAVALGDGAEALGLVDRAEQKAAEYGFDLKKMGAVGTLRPDALAAAGRPAEAVDAYQALIAETPGGSGAWRRLGEAQAAAGDRAGAQRSLARALELTPANPKAHLALARLLRDRPAEARRHLRSALAAWSQADPGFRPAQEARALLGSLGGTRIPS